ncbi:DUF5681 domain-containing protein [Vibrio breoganii]
MAKFEKGQSGNPAGRPRGSRNKYTKKMLETAMHQLVNRDINPLEKLINLATSTQDDKLAAKIWTDILGYTNAPEYREEDKDGNDVVFDRSELIEALKKELTE